MFLITLEEHDAADNLSLPSKFLGFSSLWGAFLSRSVGKSLCLILSSSI